MRREIGAVVTVSNTSETVHLMCKNSTSDCLFTTMNNQLFTVPKTSGMCVNVSRYVGCSTTQEVVVL